ncbi:hypothetical protein T459_25017 [Capsicum annuum]|uniref:Phospho-2-dehydro-3-deoxyheptonate aldolase n=1 Tax=Capsicum annuum TaxID=4072 RepID=A0A2G2YJJ5_CAPAN|nr:hypothetical protein T459_25017 [Capsicum annuum]
MIRAYTHSVATLNLLRAFTTGGYAAMQRVNLWNLDFTDHSKHGDRYFFCYVSTVNWLTELMKTWASWLLLGLQLTIQSWNQGTLMRMVEPSSGRYSNENGVPKTPHHGVPKTPHLSSNGKFDFSTYVGYVILERKDCL